MHARAMAGASAPAAAEPRTIRLPVRKLTPEAFRPFGQVVSAGHDGKEFDEQDAQLQLDQGTPRFYIMRIPRRGLRFDKITYHARVTQCLGGLSTQPWFLAVAPPSGSVAAYPTEQELQAFRIEHGSFVKLHAGTWHAGPLFAEAAEMDFYNLELKDTNVVDHNIHDYSKDGLAYELVES